MLFTHLVLSGGGHTLLQTWGALMHLEEQHHQPKEKKEEEGEEEEENKRSFSLLESIYATSAGALAAVFFSMPVAQHPNITQYLIHRPWQNLFPLSAEHGWELLLSHSKGLYGNAWLDQAFQPLLQLSGFSFDVTLEEWFQFTHIDLHFFTFDMNQHRVMDVSHSTFPELPLLTALQMTSAIPGLIQPVLLEGHCFIDGGLLCNYPLNECLANLDETQHDKVLGIYVPTPRSSVHIDNSTLNLEFFFSFFYECLLTLSAQQKTSFIRHEIQLQTEPCSIEVLWKTLTQPEKRSAILEAGKQDAANWLQTRRKFQSVLDSLGMNGMNVR